MTGGSGTGARRVGIAERLVRRSVPRTVVAGSILGDLHEDYERLRARRTALVAVPWYWWQVLRIVGAFRGPSRRGNELGPMPPRDPGRVATRTSGLVDELRQDLRMALRGLWLRPAFAAVVVTTLALGIGANAAMYGLVDRLLLSAPPHIADPDSVVRLEFRFEDRGGREVAMTTASYPLFTGLREGVPGLARVAAIRRQEMVLGEGVQARAIRVGRVAGDYFDTLGTRPGLGRLFGAREDELPTGTPVAVASHVFWRSELGGDESALGRPIVVGGATLTVIGVAPHGFTGDSLDRVDVWIPYSASALGDPPGWAQAPYRNVVSVVARLAPDATPEAARQAAGESFRRQMEVLAPGAAASARVTFADLVPGRDANGTSEPGRIALWVGAVAAIVLLIAIANVTSLFLVRGLARRHEIAVRTALGMGGGRLVRSLLTESAVLATLGALAGVLVAGWTGGLARALLLPDAGAPAQVVDRSVVLAAAAAAVLAALVAGLVPTVYARGTAVATGLQLAGKAGGDRGSQLRRALLVGQTALSTVLLFGAGLFVVSLQRAQSEDLGIRVDEVLLANVDFVDGTPPAARGEIYERAAAAVAGIAGVSAATPTMTIPFGPRIAMPVFAPDVAEDPFARQFPYLNPVAPEYFEILGLRLISGRMLDETDTREAPLVLVVSERMAEMLWPGEDPLGKCLRVGGTMSPAGIVEDPAAPCREVVGVAADARRRSIRPEEEWIVQHYMPASQYATLGLLGADPSGPDYWALIVRAAGDPAAVVATVRSSVQSLSPSVRHVQVQAYAELIDPQIRPFRLGATMFSLLGALALGMAAIGLYGALTYSIARRRREMGVRMALGASSPTVVRLVVREGLTVSALGFAIGTGLALLLAGRIAPLLFETEPRNPVILVAVALVLGLVGAAASLVPARRATRTDPAAVLRSD